MTIKPIIFSALAGIGTLGAFGASHRGWGLSGILDKPVSIREASTAGHRGGRPFYFFSGPRRHFGGGFSGGK